MTAHLSYLRWETFIYVEYTTCLYYSPTPLDSLFRLSIAVNKPRTLELP